MLCSVDTTRGAPLSGWHRWIKPKLVSNSQTSMHERRCWGGGGGGGGGFRFEVNNHSETAKYTLGLEYELCFKWFFYKCFRTVNKTQSCCRATTACRYIKVKPNSNTNSIDSTTWKQHKIISVNLVPLVNELLQIYNRGKVVIYTT